MRSEKWQDYREYLLKRGIIDLKERCFANLSQIPLEKAKKIVEELACCSTQDMGEEDIKHAAATFMIQGDPFATTRLEEPELGISPFWIVVNPRPRS